MTASLPIVALWRYPVKSMQGESLAVADIGPTGIVGDRAAGIVDTTTGYVLTAKREPRLLDGTGVVRDDGSVVVRLPDGTVTGDAAALSEWLGRPVRLEAATPDRQGTYEITLDFETESLDTLVQWQGPAGSFHDSTRTQVSILATGSIAPWDSRRFRGNVIVDAGSEIALVGSTVAAGTARLEVVKEIDRCILVTRPQPGGLGRDLDVLKTIIRERAGNLGVGSMVVQQGHVAVGDVLVPG
jgi:uncharacterized protein